MCQCANYFVSQDGPYLEDPVDVELRQRLAVMDRRIQRLRTVATQLEGENRALLQKVAALRQFLLTEPQCRTDSR